jgi:hypothetical protein
MPNYKWEINDETVNIVPIKGRDSRFEKLLNTKIKNYLLVKSTGEPSGNYIIAIRKAIYLLPEFSGTREVLGLSILERRFDTDGFSLMLDLKEDLSFTNLTFRELLNGITKSKKGGWILKITHYKGREFLDLQI